LRSFQSPKENAGSPLRLNLASVQGVPSESRPDYRQHPTAGCQNPKDLGKRVKELLGLTNLLGIFADLDEKGYTHF
jgi:hypothetical protein